MPEDSNNIINRINDNPDLVDIMIGIEDYLDRNDIYAFKNWILGELIDGPHIKPYWITVSFKWAYEKMPDPMAGLRFLPQGTQIQYRQDEENVPQPIKEPSDYDPGTHKPKIKSEKIWVVEIKIPRRFIENLDHDILELYDDELDDTDTVEDAKAEGQTEQQATGGTDAAGF